MRVALLSSNAKAGDAIGNQVAEKLAFFRDRGAEVRVFLESADRLHPALASHCQLMQPRANAEAWDFLSHADLVCVEFGHFYGLLGLLPLLRGGKPRILVDYHGITPAELWSEHNREAVHNGLRHRGLVWHADRILVHSRFLERELLEFTGVPSERICRIGLPVAVEEFQRAKPDDTFRRRLQRDDAVAILYVGRVAPNKRVPVLVEALGRLREHNPPVHLFIVGDTGDLYQSEVDKCRRLATELGVAERVHFLGHLSDDQLREAYRSADLFVIASRWEGFCIPVVEAMASGLPVVAARAAALPETLADAGVTFNPDDADDLARKIERIFLNRDHSNVLAGSPNVLDGSADPASPDKIAIVASRYGRDIVGGAEWSLRRIAESLHDAGHAVEVFTTCNRAEARWLNESPEGTSIDGGISVHRFPIDDHDRASHLRTVQAIVQSGGEVSRDIETSYLAHSLHSSRLIEALKQRQNEFSAIIVGPYLFGLTADIARSFPDKTLLLPCFHDEPLARLNVWKNIYGNVAGILYHSPEEQDFAQVELGLNHPGAAVIGTWIEIQPRLAATRSGAMTPSPGRYLVYCGRYSPEKELPRLLEYAERYHDQHPGRFTFVFMGQGGVPIPRHAWAIDLGFVDDARKAEVLRGAEALVLLSEKESLSLVALEAWAQETPVVVSSSCDVLVGHLRRCDGGLAVADYPAFSQTLDNLWDNPDAWRTRGRRGRAYVEQHFGSASEFLARLRQALAEMRQPWIERMRQRGLSRALEFSRPRWQEAFATIVEQALHGAPLAELWKLKITPSRQQYRSQRGTDTLCSVQVVNHGNQPAWADGPGRTFLCCQVLDEIRRTPLPELLLPGQQMPAVITVPGPESPGRYEVTFWCEDHAADRGRQVECARTSVELLVGDGAGEGGPCAPLLDNVQTLLARVQRLKDLPESYLDVTEGWFASAKRWLKRKLLNNFKAAYVDVLSRQQSQVNRELLTAVQELAECCATLDHAVRVLSTRPLAVSRLPDPERVPDPAGQRVE